ncbi:cholinephosphotransferase 1, partial [Clarias magur]
RHCAEEGEITRHMEIKDISKSCTCNCLQPAHGLTSGVMNVAPVGHRVCVEGKAVY